MQDYVYLVRFCSERHVLGEGLLKQRGPELRVLRRVHEDELVVVGGKTVVHDDVRPLAVLPEPEAEDPGIVLAEALVRRNHVVEEVLVGAEGGDGSQQPAVTCREREEEG